MSLEEARSKQLAQYAKSRALLPPRGRGAVYFVACGPYVKVGFARNVYGRFHTIKTDNPVEVELIEQVEGTRSLEKDAHLEFHQWRHRGEWFHATPEFLDAAIAWVNRNKRNTL